MQTKHSSAQLAAQLRLDRFGRDAAHVREQSRHPAAPASRKQHGRCAMPSSNETPAHQELDRIATGHNADDNAETVLLHLFRGAGVRGLAGIPVSRNDGHIIRPLLFATREEIAAYAA